MGALDGEHFDAELENGVKLGCLELGGEEEPDTLAIQDAVKVLLQGLGEDVNREGLKKTPLRVAKAFLEGTRGTCQLLPHNTSSFSFLFHYRDVVSLIHGKSIFVSSGMCRIFCCSAADSGS